MEILDANVEQNEVRMLNDNSLLMVTILHDKEYAYNVVTYIKDKYIKALGQYASFNHNYSTEWVEYNDDYIVFLLHINSDLENEYEVLKIFDIKEQKFIRASKEELLAIYEEIKKQDVKRK